jgi:two-component system, NtrC family, sensor kinase
MKNVLSEAMNIKADLATEINSPRRYQLLRRKIVSLMALVTILPLVSLAGINYYEHQSTMAAEIQAPLRALVGKAKHSFELFLAERTSAVSFIASAYSFDELSTTPTCSASSRSCAGNSRDSWTWGSSTPPGTRSAMPGPTT